MNQTNKTKPEHSSRGLLLSSALDSCSRFALQKSFTALEDASKFKVVHHYSGEVARREGDSVPDNNLKTKSLTSPCSWEAITNDY